MIVSTQQVTPYKSINKIRVVTAASLFDGHDASINIMRRILQSTGAEVIHLGHNRSVAEIVDCAIQEDAQAIAITSYQGGHVEYLKYMYDLLKEKGAGHIKIFAGGGGTILPSEIEELHAYGITRIYHPDDGRAMGLQGMINDLLQKSDFATITTLNGEFKKISTNQPLAIARMLTYIENNSSDISTLINELDTQIQKNQKVIPVLGITGTGGAGKSSLTDELVRRFISTYPQKKLAIISVDPTKRKTGGALLGDRIRMNSIHHPNIYMRSFATREANLSINKSIHNALKVLKAAGFDMIIVESAGIGQSDSQIMDFADVALYVMTPEFGAATQLEKIDMLDFADIVCINKFDKKGALDALRDVKKQYQRNHQLFSTPVEQMPVFGTIASQFNDPRVNQLFVHLIKTINHKTQANFPISADVENVLSEKVYIIPPHRTRYLAEIAEESERYNNYVNQQSKLATQAYQLFGTLEYLKSQNIDTNLIQKIQEEYNEIYGKLSAESRKILETWQERKSQFTKPEFSYFVRGKEIKVNNFTESLSHLQIPKIAVPKFKDWGDIIRWNYQENFPGEFPYTAGVYPYKRTNEDPTRMFAGEGGPERTNKRFHYVSLGMPAKRLSTAFDSVTLYGENPDFRPDIYGKIGNSGVSIACLDDAKKLYSGFDLCDPTTSVSMTINGPAPMLLAFFMNTAIDQQCEKYIKANGLVNEVNEKILRIYSEKWAKITYEQDKDTRFRSSNFLGANCYVTKHHNKKKFEIFLMVQPYNSSEEYGLTTCNDNEYVEWREKWLIPKFLYDLMPQYHGQLPEGNNGLGLLLLGVTGDQVLPKEVYEKIKQEAISVTRGTVQADILKEDQAQNTCIFSTEFALKMMGDIQEYFIQNKVRNFYSVSISGYHIAEAGANPITQLALTLSNGFTFVEYYLSRGMHIDDFAPNLSFFFSNGMDPEYSVIGRVARRIWAKAMKNKYGANERSQMLKYHIQTSGRSLHAQEIDFNDIRTTLQALYAIYDNCNSLHTNAYDEAITTPTEESVRRAMAIQLIINKELGLAKNENPLQGSFIIEELTDLVEEAVLMEFKRISERGGVLGAMETMYQRNKIQEESLYYETLKHSGQYPVIGVNTFLNKNGSPTIIPAEVIRSTEEEKLQQIQNIQRLHKVYNTEAENALLNLKKVALKNQNIFQELMETAKVCSLGQISKALYEVGGQYRRNM